MRYIAFLILFCITLFANEIEVTVIYGEDTPSKVVTATYKDGTTALELLKQVCVVETSKKGKFTFVRSIDGVKSDVGKMGWFYLIDGESVHKMAENYVLDGAKSMIWILKVEACY